MWLLTYFLSGMNELSAEGHSKAKAAAKKIHKLLRFEYNCNLNVVYCL